MRHMRGCTLIELLIFVTGIGGAALLCIIGYKQFDWPGAILGIPIGFFAGILGASLLLWILEAIDDFFERRKRRKSLANHFGPYWKSPSKRQWKRLKLQLAIGQQIEGRVVQQHSYEAVIDTGHCFPAQIFQWDMEDGPESKIPTVGEPLTARVTGFNNWKYEIHLSQQGN